MAGDISFHSQPSMGTRQRGDVVQSSDFPEPRTCVYSARLFQPFIRLLDRSSIIPAEWAQAMRSLDLDERMPAATAHQLLDGVLALGVPVDIGLHAAREWSPGDGGALDYAVTSASTVRDAIEAAKRYMRLVNDAVSIELEVVGAEARIKVENFLPMSRTVLDFQAGSLFRLFRCIWASGARASLRVLLAYPEPADLKEHNLTFDNVPLVFDSPHQGFSFDAKLVDVRLTSGDFRLHDTIRLYAEQMLQELPRSRSLTGWIESAIASELPKGAPGVNRIATRLRMSTRTLERRLEREGTTFSELLEDMRRRLALRYVANASIPLGEIAFLLGFSHTTGFHRAFKRWTGETPLGYRRAQAALTSRSGESA
jgi:AraC-like DNA-binding protein